MQVGDPIDLQLADRGAVSALQHQLSLTSRGLRGAVASSLDASESF